MWFSINLNGFGDLSAKIVKYRSPLHPLTWKFNDTMSRYRSSAPFNVLLPLFFFYYYYFIFLRVFPHHIIKGVRDCLVWDSRNLTLGKIGKIRIRSITVGNFRDFESLDSRTIQKSAISSTLIPDCNRMWSVEGFNGHVSIPFEPIVLDFTSRSFVQNQKFRDLSE